MAKRPQQPQVRLCVEPQAGSELRGAVSSRLDLFNVATTGLDRWHAVSVFLRDPDEEIVGGILGDIWGGWLHVTHLWVAEWLRGRGHASALLRTAEDLAAVRGCHAARLESYTFQAPDFYVKHGYQVFGVLDDCPPGHQQVFLRKSLPRHGAAAATTSRRAPTRSRKRSLRS